MSVNKVVYGGNTLIDLTSDTVTADTLVTGYTAHGKDGSPVAGANPYAKAATDAEVNEQTGLLDTLAEVIDTLPEAGGGGSAGTCTVTVDFPACSPPKYFQNGIAGFSYIDANGDLQNQEVTGITSTVGPSKYTFEPVECKCGTVLSVTSMQGNIAFAKSSDEISDPVTFAMVNNAFLTATFMLPENPGNYTITLYYGT